MARSPMAPGSVTLRVRSTSGSTSSRTWQLDTALDTFMFWGEGEDQLPRFAEEVAPAVRAAGGR